VNRIADCVAHGSVDREDSHHWVGVFAGQDAEQCRPLRLASPFVDDRLHGPVALMNGTGPCDGERQVQAIELCIAKPSSVDSEEDDRTTVTLRRQRIELTGAAVCTAAIGEHEPVDLPIGHHLLPNAVVCLAR
jgi:hypothetical protein